MTPCSNSCIFFALIGSFATLLATSIITSIGVSNISVKSLSDKIEDKINDIHNIIVNVK